MRIMDKRGRGRPLGTTKYKRLGPKTTERVPAIGKPVLMKKRLKVTEDKYNKEFIENEAEKLFAWLNRDQGLYLTEFCRERGYGRSKLNEFALKNEIFADTLELAKTWQECKVVRGAMTKVFDSTFARYFLARMCGDIWKASFDTSDPAACAAITVQINEIHKTSEKTIEVKPNATELPNLRSPDN
jgi:hypothetical protein